VKAGKEIKLNVKQLRAWQKFFEERSGKGNGDSFNAGRAVTYEILANWCEHEHQDFPMPESAGVKP
jgi:hypothetical protein